MKRNALAPVETVEPTTAGIGHNAPPEPSPFERVEKRIRDLYDEALLWLDGRSIEDQATADGLANLLNMIREAEKEADEARKVENKPFDDGKAEVQARYAPLIADTKSVKGLTVLAADACKKALAPWLVKVETEKAAEAKRLLDIADQERLAAEDAIRAARTASLAEQAAAEALLAGAKWAERAATSASKDTARSGSVGRAVGLRSVYTATIDEEAGSYTAAARHYFVMRPAEFRELVIRLAQEDVNAKRPPGPGIKVVETKVAQ